MDSESHDVLRRLNERDRERYIASNVGSLPQMTTETLKQACKFGKSFTFFSTEFYNPSLS